MTTKKTDLPAVQDVGYDFNALLRQEPDEIRVSYALLQDPGPQLSLANFGYLKFGGGLIYRPVGFDLDQSAVICARVY